MKKWETALLSFRHPKHSRGIFFVCRFLFPVYIHLHETPCFQVIGSAVFPVPPSPHIAYRTANEKDFSLPLEMTMREGGTLPPSHGRRCPEGAEVGFLSGMKKWETALLSFRHPEHSRGIFFVCCFLFPVYIHLHETPCFQVVGSAVFPVPPLLTSLTGPQTKKISRFRSK